MNLSCTKTETERDELSIRMHSNHSQKTSRPLALVTGASSGIGTDLARELARDGHDLVLVARRETLLQTLAVELESYGARSTVLATNLGVCAAASRLKADWARLGLGEPDVLVNAAGFGDYANFLQAEPTKLTEMLHLNVVALTELTRAFLPGMVSRGRGRVLLVGTLSGFAPEAGSAVYHATKAYVLSLGEALAKELRYSRVTLTTLCPGPTLTGFCDAAGHSGENSAERSPFLMKSADVAREAYRAMKNGRRIVVPGWGNKLRALFLRHAPWR